MKEILTYRGLVYPWQCDHMGHMNVMFYTGKFDEASWALLTRLGLGQPRLQALGRAMAAVQQNTTYKRELFAGDVVTIRTTLTEIRNKVIRFVHEMVNDATGEVAAISDLTGVHMNALTRRSTEFPDDVFHTVRKLAEGQENVLGDAVELTKTLDQFPMNEVGYASMCD